MKRKKGRPFVGKRKGLDFYAKKAKKEDYPARSIYKLEEIQAKYRILEKNDRVLDLGCFPGSWLIYASKVVGPGGRVIGVDIKEIEIDLPGNTKALQADVLTAGASFFSQLGTLFDVVISDMAPSTTGRKDVDAARSFALCEAALAIAMECLKPGGHFVCKIFQGPDFKSFSESVKSTFAKLRIYKPRACRKESKEIYIIGMDRLQEEA